MHAYYECIFFDVTVPHREVAWWCGKRFIINCASPNNFLLLPKNNNRNKTTKIYFTYIATFILIYSLYIFFFLSISLHIFGVFSFTLTYNNPKNVFINFFLFLYFHISVCLQTGNLCFVSLFSCAKIRTNFIIINYSLTRPTIDYRSGKTTYSNYVFLFKMQNGKK